MPVVAGQTCGRSLGSIPGCFARDARGQLATNSQHASDLRDGRTFFHTERKQCDPELVTCCLELFDGFGDLSTLCWDSGTTTRRGCRVAPLKSFGDLDHGLFVTQELAAQEGGAFDNFVLPLYKSFSLG